MKLPVSEIVVGERRRQDMGDLAGLAASILKHGLIHPVVIDADKNLVAGGRRLEAVKLLDWEEVDVRDMGELTPLELREIELEENLRRKDLTAFERSRFETERIDNAKELAKEQAKVGFVHNVNETPNKGGRPKVVGSVRDVAEMTGIPLGAQTKAKQHVQVATKYPFMQKPDWSQAAVLTAREALTELDPDEQDRAAALVDQPGIPPKDAVEILSNLKTKPKEEREGIYGDFESGVPKRVERAKTAAAAAPTEGDAKTGRVWVQRTLWKPEHYKVYYAELRLQRDECNTVMELLRDECKERYEVDIDEAF